MLCNLELFLLFFLVSIICASWNCRGAGAPIFVRHFKELTQLHDVSIFGIVEPRIGGRTASNVIKRLGFSNHILVESQGFAGGLWLLWIFYSCLC